MSLFKGLHPATPHLLKARHVNPQHLHKAIEQMCVIVALHTINESLILVGVMVGTAASSGAIPPWLLESLVPGHSLLPGVQLADYLV